ncbi:MAG: hypothetical protein JW882_03990 [Deltaproteobacteria bacterium]|nr:hypothetical protein [Deltaproteobacteria bacterium]
MARREKAILFGCIHFFLQVSVYISAFALGPAIVTRRVLGISLYDVAVIITFPFVYLFEKLQWSGFGIGVFVLNSVVWAGIFYLALVAMARKATKRNL